VLTAVWSDASSAVLRARAGADLGWFTPSIALFTALFQDPGQPNDYRQDGGLRAWGVAAQARFHTVGRHQFIGGVGVGWGQLTALRAENGAGGFRGNDAPYVQAFTGYRAVLGRARLGFELTLDGFNRVDRLADFQSGILPSCASTSRCPSGRTLWLPGMALNFGVDLR